MTSLPKSLGELRRSQWSEERIARRTVRQELRENLMCKMEKGEAPFSGVHGYGDACCPDHQRDSLAASFSFARAARTGEIAHFARSGGIHGPANPGSGRLRDPR